MNKQLKKRILNDIFWILIVALVSFGSFFVIFPAKSAGLGPFCKEWNTMGDMDGGEPLTPPQRQMWHLGYYLTKSDFVREMLIKNYPDRQLFVDHVITCYEEHTPVLVDEINDICQCSKDDKRDKADAAFNDYINECIKETR